MFKKRLLTSLFSVKTGDFHATKELGEGNIPLISCGEADNGLVGYYDIPENKTYSNTITVAYNGIPLTVKYHPYSFGAKDDVAVLIPNHSYAISTLIYIAAILNNQKWRYSYGRKCFRNKLEDLKIMIPIDTTGDIDENLIKTISLNSFQTYLPKTNPSPLDKQQDLNAHKLQLYKLSDLFDIKNGNYHKIDGLDTGAIPLVSCSDENNGISGYYDITDTTSVYENTLTVTFDGKPLTVKYQSGKFACYDNVGVLLPLKKLKKSTLIYIGGLIALQQWRYSYGRKCYRQKLNNISIKLPIDSSNAINEDLISMFVKSTSYTDLVLN